MAGLRARTNAVVNIIRNTEVGDGYGGKTTAPTILYSGWKIRLHGFYPFFSETQHATEIGTNRSAFDYKAHGVPPNDINLQEGDSLVITSAPYDHKVGDVFEILSVYPCEDRTRVHHLALSIRKEHA
jgi:hypothetical protein